jgi:DUF4097 and DUF4098 domain-containing protein YvlB
MRIRTSLTITLAIAAFMLLTGCEDLFFFDFDMSDYRYKFDDSYEADLDGVEQLALTIINGSITIETWDRDRIEIDIEERIKARDEDDAEELADGITLDGEIRGDTLVVDIDWGEFYSKRRRYACNLDIRLPASLQLKLKTTNGSIGIDPMNNRVRATTTNGSVTSRGATEAELYTTNGRIEATNIDGEILARTTNGSLHLESLNGPVTGDTTNGSISAIINSVLTGDVELSTTNGNISLRVHSDSSFFIHAGTSNGRIDDSLHGGSFDYNRRRTSMEGSYNGDRNSVSLGTTNGNIDIS